LIVYVGDRLAGNVSRTREVAKQAKRVLSAKIEFIRENGAEATQNQQFLVTAVTCCPNHAIERIRVIPIKIEIGEMNLR